MLPRVKVLYFEYFFVVSYLFQLITQTFNVVLAVTFFCITGLLFQKSMKLYNDMRHFDYEQCHMSELVH